MATAAEKATSTPCCSSPSATVVKAAALDKDIAGVGREWSVENGRSASSAVTAIIDPVEDLQEPPPAKPPAKGNMMWEPRGCYFPLVISVFSLLCVALISFL